MRPGGFFLGLLSISFGLSAIFSVFNAEAKTRVEVSIFYPGAPWNVSSLNTFQNQLGVNFSSVKWYMDWDTAFDSTAANNLHNNGYLPELTWQPQENGTGVDYDQVVAGNYDTYINQTAQGVKNLGYPVRISLAPEMNATWTPWGGLAGNNPSNFRAFWKHTVDIFRAQGANNVSWIWSPNVIPYITERVGTYAQMYPGNSYVDYMGLDGYNWGTSQSWSVWQSFSEVFLASYNELKSVSSKDILIMEVGSTEKGGDKAAWITDMYKQLASGFSQIKGFTWFNINKETDWRINSSNLAKQSFINGYLGVVGVANNPSSTPTASSPAPATQPAPTTTQPLDKVVKTLPTIDKNPETIRYKTTNPIEPKIAGTSYSNPAPLSTNDKVGVLGSLLIGGTMVGSLFFRRFRLLHALHIKPTVEPIAKVGHTFIDGVFHPGRSTATRKL